MRIVRHEHCPGWALIVGRIAIGWLWEPIGGYDSTGRRHHWEPAEHRLPLWRAGVHWASGERPTVHRSDRGLLVLPIQKREPFPGMPLMGVFRRLAVGVAWRVV